MNFRPLFFLLLFLLSKPVAAQITDTTLIKQLLQHCESIYAYSAAINKDKKSDTSYVGRALERLWLYDVKGSLKYMDKAVKLKATDTTYFIRGYVNLIAHNYENAINDNSKALALNPRYKDAFNNRGNALEGIHKIDLAIDDYTKAIEIDSQYAMAWYNLGNMKLKKEDYAGALQAFNQAIKFDSANVNHHFNRGHAYAGLKDYANAYVDFKHAAELDTVNPKYLYQVGYIKNEAKDFAGAILIFNEVNDKWPLYQPAYVNRAYSKNRLFDFKGGIKDCSKAIELDPEDATAYSNRGAAKFQLKDSSNALFDLNRAIYLNPKFDIPYITRSQIKLGQGHINEALKDADIAISLAPANSEYYNYRGTIYSTIKKNDLAIADYNRSIGINPLYYEPRRNGAMLYFNTNNYKSALYQLDTAIILEPRIGELFGKRGVLKLQMGDTTQALADLKRAFELDSTDHNSLFFLSHVYLATGKYAAAIFVMDKAIELRPLMAKYYTSRAYAYAKIKMNVKSMADYDKAVELEPADGRLYFMRGLMKDNMYDRRGCCEDLQRAQQLNYHQAPYYLNLYCK